VREKKVGSLLAKTEKIYEKARRTFHALGDVWWLMILKFAYKKSVVELNLSLSCRARRRHAPCWDSHKLGTVSVVGT